MILALMLASQVTLSMSPCTIDGVPGDASSFNARFFSRVFHDIRKQRDIVLVDLRGTGKSSPLFGPELGQAGANGVLDENLLSVSAVRACRQRLEKTTDLAQYTTEIAVDDLEEVRQRLGYGPINLHGTSYGSRVAQVYMRRYPNSIRAVAMKGVVPASMAAPEDHAKAGDDAWRSVVARCGRDAACHEAYPLVDVEFRELLKLHQSVNGDDRGVVETALTGRGLLGGERLSAGFFLCCRANSIRSLLHQAPRQWFGTCQRGATS